MLEKHKLKLNSRKKKLSIVTRININRQKNLCYLTRTKPTTTTIFCLFPFFLSENIHRHFSFPFHLSSFSRYPSLDRLNVPLLARTLVVYSPPLLLSYPFFANLSQIIPFVFAISLLVSICILLVSSLLLITNMTLNGRIRSTLHCDRFLKERNLFEHVRFYRSQIESLTKESLFSPHSLPRPPSSNVLTSTTTNSRFIFVIETLLCLDSISSISNSTTSSIP